MGFDNKEVYVNILQNNLERQIRICRVNVIASYIRSISITKMCMKNYLNQKGKGTDQDMDKVDNKWVDWVSILHHNAEIREE